MSDEILFREDPFRKAILPIRYERLWANYKKLQGLTWTAEEISFKDDIAQIQQGKVKPEILAVVKYVLGFFFRGRYHRERKFSYELLI